MWAKCLVFRVSTDQFFTFFTWRVNAVANGTFVIGQMYLILACTRSKAGREVGALNWTQLHKSIWDGPASKATGHAPRLARDWPVPLSYHQPAHRRAGELAGNCALQRSWPMWTFSKWAILHRFPNCSTLRVEIFRMFYPFTSTYDPNEPWKVSWKSVRTFLRNPEARQTDTHTDRQTRQLYIYRLWDVLGTPDTSLSGRSTRKARNAFTSKAFRSSVAKNTLNNLNKQQTKLVTHRSGTTTSYFNCIYLFIKYNVFKCKMRQSCMTKQRVH